MYNHSKYKLGKSVQSDLERQFIKDFLHSQGFPPGEILNLPDDQRRELFRLASRYASLKLAEIEARSKFVQKIT